MRLINVLPVLVVPGLIAFWALQHYGFSLIISLLAALASAALGYFADLKLSEWRNSSRK
ncbi:hypothetical protein [Roseibium album]|uniref:hypothetical protein n=1 Tax=Roseibium album TaxID=311410 RepID=UPI00131A5C38|nr:hypothetical protein [Labrenzia sp. EL_142]MBG6165768.1 hypothetical protein [Labrenzia sp. EL_195]